MPSSMLMVVPNTPQFSEPLPVYTFRDPETSSIRSLAPSYVSEAPTYHSTIPASTQPARATATGLPPPSYAPGLHRTPTRSGDISHLNFNISEWSAARSGPQARHYKNVANRRVSLAGVEENTRLTCLAAGMTFPALRPAEMGDAIPAESASSVSGRGSTRNTSDPATVVENTDAGPVSPFEDPDLVGVEAANAARERRLYMIRCMDDREALRQENKSWDFMLSQMADRKERERSWEKFRRDIRKNKVLGRLLR